MLLWSCKEGVLSFTIAHLLTTQQAMYSSPERNPQVSSHQVHAEVMMYPHDVHYCSFSFLKASQTSSHPTAHR